MGALPSSSETIMCALILVMTVLFSKVTSSVSFTTPTLHQQQQQQRSSIYHRISFMPWKETRIFSEVTNNNAGSATTDESEPNSWTHEQIQWKIRPPPETSFFRKLALKAAANGIRLDCKLKGQDPPPVLCPKGGQAVLEAYQKGSGLKGKKMARFGITTLRGPSSPEIDETIREAYGIVNLPFGGVGIAAIIYMFVEPEFRKGGLGELALEAIAAIHTVQGCDFTVLVADDNGSGKLVEWYEKNGYVRAPKLQTIMGSPNGEYGVTMIAPTAVSADFFQKCQIKWW